MKDNKKRISPMEKLTQGYEAFIKGKKLNKIGKDAFDKVIKKASKPRSAK